MSVLPAPRSPRQELPQLCSAASGPRTTLPKVPCKQHKGAVERKQGMCPPSCLSRLPPELLTGTDGVAHPCCGRDPVAVLEMARLEAHAALATAPGPGGATPSHVNFSRSTWWDSVWAGAPPRGRGPYCQARRWGRQAWRVFEAWRPRRALRLAPSPPGFLL